MSNEMTRLMDYLGRKEPTQAEIYANIRDKALDDAIEAAMSICRNDPYSEFDCGIMEAVEKIKSLKRNPNA